MTELKTYLAHKTSLKNKQQQNNLKHILTSSKIGERTKHGILKGKN